MTKYRFPKTRNHGFRRPKDGAICPSNVEGKTLCSIQDESSLESQLAVSQAISPAVPLSTSREKPTTETNDKIHKSGNQSCSESKQPAKPNCYQCKHRDCVSYSAHSQCKHPILDVIEASQFIPLLYMMKGLRSPFEKKLNVTYNQHGFNNGWFFWPINFDPVWLYTCDGFEEKD